MLHRVTRETHKRASHFRHIWEDKLGSVFWAVRLGGSGWKVEWRILCKSIPLKMKIYSSIYLCETCTFKPKPYCGGDGLWDRAGPLTLTVSSDALNKPFSWVMTGAMKSLSFSRLISNWTKMWADLEGDRIHVVIITLLYCLQGIPLGLVRATTYKM